MSRASSEKKNYGNEIIRFLCLNGPLSKYGISKRARIPYPTTLRLIERLEKSHLIVKIGGGRRKAEIFAVTEEGIVVAHLLGIIATPELVRAWCRSNEELNVATPLVEKTVAFLEKRKPLKKRFLETMSEFFKVWRELTVLTSFSLTGEMITEPTKIKEVEKLRSELVSELKRIPEDNRTKLKEALSTETERLEKTANFLTQRVSLLKKFIANI